GGGVEADAGRQPGVGVRDRGLRSDRRLAYLDLRAMAVAKRNELACALKIVMDSVGGGDMRVAIVHQVVEGSTMQQHVRRAGSGTDDTRPTRCRSKDICDRQESSPD